MLNSVYIDSFKYALGERKCHVSDSAAAGRLFSSAGDLRSAGFCWHRRGFTAGIKAGQFDLD
jgi:hypothetical protein